MYIKWILVCLVVVGQCSYLQPLYAEWAHDHVVWLNGKEQNQSLVEKLVDDYLKNGIPVGGVNIDSAWSQNFNDFTWNRTKFPDPEGMVKRFHAKGVKVMLWATSMINQQCPLYAVGVKNNYFLNKGKTAKWWHGKGAFLDFTNKNATQWWFSLMDKVLNIGIDGFKCDGTDPLIILLGLPKTSKGIPIGIHQYGHLYYGHFYNHTKSKNKDGLIMSRPCDSFSGLYLSYSPKYMMFAGWVGDQDSSADGFKIAILRLLHSAWEGYLNFGFDIGGYRGQNISKNIFIRWVQSGALVPFMENGGNGKHQPWSFDQETVNIYRNFVLIHQSLKPFFLTAGPQAFALKKSVIQPIARKQYWLAFKDPQSYGYILWHSILVFPIFDEWGSTSLDFPSGSKWIYYFNHSKVFNGGTKQSLVFPLSQSPIFYKEDTIIPMQDQIVIVYPSTNHYKQFIYPDYTIYFQLTINQQSINILSSIYPRQSNLQIKLPSTINIIGINKSDKITNDHRIKFSSQPLSIRLGEQIM